MNMKVEGRKRNRETGWRFEERTDYDRNTPSEVHEEAVWRWVALT